MQALRVSSKRSCVYESLLSEAWEALNRADRWSNECVNDSINVEMGSARGMSATSYILYEFASELGQVKSLVNHLRGSPGASEIIKSEAEEIWTLATSYAEDFISVADIDDVSRELERLEAFVVIFRSILSFDNVQSMRKPEFKHFIDNVGKRLSALSEYISKGDLAPESLKSEIESLAPAQQPLGEYLEVF